MTTRTTSDTTQTGVATTLASRRTVTKGLAWTVPVVAAATAAPAFAVSCETFTFGPDSCKCPGQSTTDKYGYWLTICYNCPPDQNANDTTQVSIQSVSKSNGTPLEHTPKNGACADLPYTIDLNGCSAPLHFTGENSGNFLIIDYTVSGDATVHQFKIPAPPDCGAVLDSGGNVVIPSKCDETGGCP